MVMTMMRLHGAETEAKEAQAIPDDLQLEEEQKEES